MQAKKKVGEIPGKPWTDFLPLRVEYSLSSLIPFYYALRPKDTETINSLILLISLTNSNSESNSYAYVANWNL